MLKLLQRQSASELLIDYVRPAGEHEAHIHTSSSSLIQMFIDKLRLQSGGPPVPLVRHRSARSSQ